MTYKNCIMVGIDYSPNSDNALCEAARIANWNDAALCCLHVIDEDVLDGFRDDKGFDEQAIRRAALGRLEEHVGEVLGAAREVRCKVEIGHPFKELIQAVDGSGSRLLVLGSHGLGKSDPKRTGAFASRCVRKAPVDVLLVRGGQSDPFASIVACVDFSENSIRGAYRAAEIAAQDKAALELLHIFCSPIYAAADVGGYGPVLPPSAPPGIPASLRTRLEKLAEEIGNECGVEVRASVVDQAGVAVGIVEHLLQVSADLAVLGTRGRTGLKRLLLGTTAERVIHESPCSTLAVKPEGFEYSL